jgi:transcriptional regulator GlxA family with amidase domain
MSRQKRQHPPAATEALSVGLVHYPGCMDSALAGLRELLGIANMLAGRAGLARRFEVVPVDAGGPLPDAPLRIFVVPPDIGDRYHDAPDSSLLAWLRGQHRQGAVACSACAGAFVLAAAGVLDGRKATTHWLLAPEFARRFPAVALDADRILVDDGDILTAGGLMSWVDLGLEIVARYLGPALMRELGRLMVVDTGTREQRYYRRFTPRFDHGDADIVKAQHYIQAHLARRLTTADIAGHCFLTERTLQRRFLRATGFRPLEYLQRLRVQRACELLEETRETVDRASLKAGYEDPGAFRRAFVRIVGLTPTEFRRRFAA